MRQAGACGYGQAQSTRVSSKRALELAVTSRGGVSSSGAENKGPPPTSFRGEGSVRYGSARPVRRPARGHVLSRNTSFPQSCHATASLLAATGQPGCRFLVSRAGMRACRASMRASHCWVAHVLLHRPFSMLCFHVYLIRATHICAQRLRAFAHVGMYFVRSTSSGMRCGGAGTAGGAATTTQPATLASLQHEGARGIKPALTSIAEVCRPRLG